MQVLANPNCRKMQYIKNVQDTQEAKTRRGIKCSLLAPEDEGSALDVEDSLRPARCFDLLPAIYSAREACITIRSISFSVSSRSE